MKHTKLVIAGITAAITLSGASAVFAEDVETVKPEGAEQTQEASAEAGQAGMLNGAKNGLANGQQFRGGMFGVNMPEEIDMSGLELPEDFVPFDEAHVPDGLHAPANGELKPIEFDAEGNMTFGQRPEMFGEMNGERPKLQEGELPELAEGERPEFAEGERPELPPVMNGEMPEFRNGELPELPEGEMPVFQNGELPEIPEGEMPEFQNGEMPELPQNGGMPSGNGGAQVAGTMF